jgi:ATP-dependent RNA helicase SUPV3L1/SUV3
VPDDLPGEQAVVESEVFYTFTWAPRRPAGAGRGPRRGDGAKSGEETRKPRDANAKPREEGGKPRFDRSDKPRGKGGKPPRGKGDKSARDDGAKTFTARPEKRDRIDPDNPFAQALSGLKVKS